VRNSLILIGLSGVAVGFAFIYGSLARSRADFVGRPVSTSPPPVRVVAAPAVESAPPAPDDARSAPLFERNRGMPSDPDLAEEYEQLNVDYFKNILPAPTVRWESGLALLGPLIAEGFSVQGLTDGRIILMNPAIERNPDQRRRALCHEMTHVAVWAQDQGHGPVFQNQLRHLAEMGAFKGIVATDEEKDAALASLHQKHAALEAAERTLQADRKTLDRSSESAVGAYNARIREHQAAIAEYNRLVEQYNLMISYPDGLARERLKLRADGTRGDDR
jgi:SprT-like family